MWRPLKMTDPVRLKIVDNAIISEFSLIYIVIGGDSLLLFN
jgi:hypothetical protein